MQILVTGGAGYIGTRLSNSLVRAGHRVRVLDVLLYGGQGLRPEVDLRRGDLRMRSDVTRALEGVDVVFHLATLSHQGTGDDTSPAAKRSLNLEATHNILREAKRRRVRRFIHGAAIDALEENEPDVEHLVIEANRPGFETTAVRMASVCGASPRQRFDLGANAMAGSAWFDGRIEITADDAPIAHLTITDAVRLYLTLLEARGPDIAGVVFEAGYETMTSRELAEQIRERLPTPNGVPAAIEITGSGETPEGGVAFDPSRLENSLGFVPEATVREMVDQLVQLMELGFLDRYDRDIYHNQRVQPEPAAPSRALRLLRRATRAFPPGL